MKTHLISIIILFLSLATLSLSRKCNPQDEKVLFQIKKAFVNHFDSWTKDSDCCTSWYGVECDPITSRINYLAIFSDVNISGTIPNAVGDLPYLETLDLRKLPNLSGQIPIALTKLTHLRFLRLNWNNLSGPVPSFLSQLKNLYFLDLSFNDLTGSIPPELSQLTNLLAIHLDRNKLTGTIPDSFGRFTGKVPDLYLSHNQLSGSLPKSLGNLNFSSIDLSRNQLVGDLSFLFGTNKEIQFLDFSRNMFEFDFSKVEFPSSLVSLDFNHNKVFGSLPAGLVALSLQQFSLQQFNVSYNRLCGQIPQGGRLQTFTSFEYFHNRCLCGAPLPAC